jgi:hypothetical protein
MFEKVMLLSRDIKDSNRTNTAYSSFSSTYSGDDMCNVLKCLLKKGSSNGSDKQGGNSASVKSDQSIGLANYPNPFNPTTVINYQLPKSGFVTLKVFDIIGREVAILVNQSQSASTYSKTFDAHNLSSGIYFYKLVLTPSDGSKQIIQQKSMQLIK